MLKATLFSRAGPRALRTCTLRPAIQPQRSRFCHQLSHPTRPSRPGTPSHLLKRQWPQARRHASTREAATKLFKEYPFSVSLATAFILFGFGMLIYINYIYRVYIIGDFAAYPEPVAAKLRRALYYTNIDLQPKNAIKYYRQALALADEIGMDPFSDEIIGVKIHLSALFEKIRMYQKAIDVLEIVKRDCLLWMEKLGGLEKNVGKRTRVLGKTIGISVRLGEFYASDEIQDQDAAEECLVWAVTTLLKEQRRREEEGVREGEGEWMSYEEIGAALESLGSHYEAKGQHYFAAPLFLQAIGLCPPRSCHSVVLMNNLAVSLAQQNPPPSLTPNQAPTSASSQLSDAQQWALKSLALAASIKPPERTEECDEGCAVATINLGDFALMEGNVQEARRRFDEGRGLSKGIGFLAGVTRADESLKGLNGTS